MFEIETERESDGRWIAEIPAIPGVMVYGSSESEAIRSVQALAFRVLADQIMQDAASEETLSMFNIASR